MVGRVAAAFLAAFLFLAPAAWAETRTIECEITWAPNTESDMSHYRIFVDGAAVKTVAHPAEPPAEISAAFPVTMTVGVPITQTVVEMTAVDLSGNESARACGVWEEDTVPPASPAGLRLRAGPASGP